MQRYHSYIAYFSIRFVRLKSPGLPITVIWCTPNCHNGIVKHELEALHRQLVCARDEVYCIVVCEHFGNICTKEETSSSGRNAPASNI